MHPMFSSQFNIPKQHYRIDDYPSVDELRKYIEKAASITGIKHCFYWVLPESSEQFTLTIHFNPKGGDPEWWLHQTTNLGEKMLWFYRTDDLSVIYPQILRSVGAPDPTKDEDLEPVSETLTSSLRAQSSGYATPGSTLNKARAEAEEQQKPALTKLLSGDLSIVSIATILQTSNQESATGRVLINGTTGDSMIQLVHGQPVHAYTPIQQGMEALLELFTWKQGAITFTPGTKPDKKTIHHPVDQILYKGAELVENISFLQEHSINESSVLRKANNQISEKEFEKVVLQGPPLGLELQKNFYKNIDENRTLQDLATFLSLSPSQWIAIVSNLIKLELVCSPTGSTGVISSAPGSIQDSAPVPPGGPGNINTPSPAVSNQVSTPPIPGMNTQIPESMLEQSRIPNETQLQSMTMDKQFAKPASSLKNTGQHNAVAQQEDTVDKQFAKPAKEVKKAKLPPPGAFKVADGPRREMDVHSPAVEAFMTQSTTMEIPSNLKAGIQEDEVKFDQGKAKAVWTALTNTETGILTEEAFQMLLEREFNRAFHTSSQLGLIVFSMKVPNTGGASRGSVESIRLVLQAVGKIKNSVDLFGHFGERGYALLLPGASSAVAVQMVDKITTNLTRFAPGLAQSRPALYFGIAAVPSDAQDVASLMNSAQVSMLEAAKRNVTRVQYQELRH